MSGETLICLDEQGIVVRGLIVTCHIGVPSLERATAQRLRIDLDLKVDRRLPERDEIGEVVDYGIVVRRVKESIEGPPVRLLETLARRVAKACFEDPRVLTTRIRIEKPDLLPDVEGLGVELVFSKVA